MKSTSFGAPVWQRLGEGARGRPGVWLICRTGVGFAALFGVVADVGCFLSIYRRAFPGPVWIPVAAGAPDLRVVGLSLVKGARRTGVAVAITVTVFGGIYSYLLLRHHCAKRQVAGHAYQGGNLLAKEKYE